MCKKSLTFSILAIISSLILSACGGENGDSSIIESSQTPSIYDITRYRTQAISQTTPGIWIGVSRTRASEDGETRPPSVDRSMFIVSPELNPQTGEIARYRFDTCTDENTRFVNTTWEENEVNNDAAEILPGNLTRQFLHPTEVIINATVEGLNHTKNYSFHAVKVSDNNVIANTISANGIAINPTISCISQQTNGSYTDINADSSAGDISIYQSDSGNADYLLYQNNEWDDENLTDSVSVEISESSRNRLVLSAEASGNPGNSAFSMTIEFP